MSLQDNLKSLQRRVDAASQRSGRLASSIQMIAVTKRVDIERVEEAITLGLTAFGENRVQEAIAKQAALSNQVSSVSWHLIGHLQRNKAKEAVVHFDSVHSVDSKELINKLEEQAAIRRKKGPLAVFLQVNVAGEKQKFGARPCEVSNLASLIISDAPHLRLNGLMTIAPYSENAEAVRPVFRQLRRIRDGLQVYLNTRPTGQPANRRTLLLSMGMSNDFEIAIEEGADVIRIGTALFK